MDNEPDTVGAVEFGLAACNNPSIRWWTGLSGTQSNVRRLLLKEIPDKSYFDGPRYFSLPLGNAIDRAIIGAIELDEQAGVCNLYLDRNNNKDILDDEILKMEKTGGPESGEYRVVTTVRVKYRGGVEKDMKIILCAKQYLEMGTKKDWQFGLGLLEAPSAKINVFGRKDVLVKLVDAGGNEFARTNGCFNNPGDDSIMIDVNGDGKLDKVKENFALSPIISFEEYLYNVKVDAAGQSLAMTPYAGPTALISCRAEFPDEAYVSDIEVVLEGQNGYVRIFRPNERAKVPAGVYRLTRGSFNFVPGMGNRIACFIEGAVRMFNVPSDKITTVKIGKPFRLEPIITGEYSPGGILSIRRKLTGAFGEVYAGVKDLAKVKIKTPDGKVLVEGVLENSRSFSGGFTWKIPLDAKLPEKVVVEIVESIPYAGECVTGTSEFPAGGVHE